MMACVTYRTENPELFSCIVRQQVKVRSDRAANAVREACLALNLAYPVNTLTHNM